MIIVDGEICYSPVPPVAYSRGSAGHGLWSRTLPQWNMAWLSFPQLEDYLDAAIPISQLLDIMPAKHFGSVIGTAAIESDAAFPGLNFALRQPPREFLRLTSDGPWENLPAYSFLGEAWVTTVMQRAQELVGPPELTAQEIAKQAIEQAMGNVIHARFGTHKRAG